MLEIEKILSGVVVIIDDALKNTESTEFNTTQPVGDGGRMLRLCRSLESRFLVAKYETYPTPDVVKNFHAVSLILLDWDLGGQKEKMEEYRTKFIQGVSEYSLAPIFIFSNLSRDVISTELNALDLHHNPGIFVLEKSEANSVDELLKKIETQLKDTPSLYVLKNWEYELKNAERALFSSMSKIDINWVSSFYQSAKEDKADPAIELQELLFTHLHARHSMIMTLDENILSVDKSDGSFSEEKVQELFQARIFIKYEGEKKPSMFFTGDLFQKGGEYFVNIRPQCDCMGRTKRRSTPSSESGVDDEQNIELYLVRGILSDRKSKHDMCNYALPFNGKFLNFSFKEFYVWDKSKLDEMDRIGRILHPYITNINQCFAAFIQRVGLPRDPTKKKK